jgi:hypothetical protein
VQGQRCAHRTLRAWQTDVLAKASYWQKQKQHRQAEHDELQVCCFGRCVVCYIIAVHLNTLHHEISHALSVAGTCGTLHALHALAPGHAGLVGHRLLKAVGRGVNLGGWINLAVCVVAASHTRHAYVSCAMCVAWPRRPQMPPTSAWPTCGSWSWSESDS